MTTTEVICEIIKKLEAQTGQKPARIEFPKADCSVKINGVDVWVSASLLGKFWLERAKDLIVEEEPNG